MYKLLHLILICEPLWCKPALVFHCDESHIKQVANPQHLSEQDFGSHGRQHHQTLLQWRHLPDNHGGAGRHVQTHPHRNLIERRQVIESGGRDDEWSGGVVVYTYGYSATMDLIWNVNNVVVVWLSMSKEVPRRGIEKAIALIRQ